jgi:glycosyltransferase involved in cell wall biosynthesis
MSPRVSVIIPSFKRPGDLQRCLRAVVSQSRPADEVVVVGREGDIETSKVVSEMQGQAPVLRIVLGSEPGLIAAMNCGLDRAAGDLLVFTDDDSEPQLDWLDRIEAAFGDESIGAVGGRDWLQQPDRPDLFRPAPVSKVGVLTWYGTQHGNHHCPLRGHAKRVMFLKGVNMAFRRRAIGSYRIDPRLRGSGAQAGTEIDLCMQARQSGFQVLFDDRIMVKHFGSPRPTGDHRGQNTGPLFPDICFNYQYLIAKRFGLFRASAYFCNSRLLGSRHVPGLLACVKWQFKGDRDAWRRLIQMARAGLAGFRLGRHARALARQNRGNLNMGCSLGD